MIDIHLKFHNNNKITFPCESLLPMNLNSDIWEEDVEEEEEEEEEKEEREAMEKEEEYNRIAVTYQWMHWSPGPASHLFLRPHTALCEMDEV